MRGTRQMGKSPAMPPPIWKNPIGEEQVFLYQETSEAICSVPDLTVSSCFSVFLMTWETKMLAVVESSQPGTKMGSFFSQAASSQEFLGSISKKGSSSLLSRS